ncbi:MAG: plasmid recombination protein [Luteolibacter sp.]
MTYNKRYYGVFRLGAAKLTSRHYASEAGMHEWHNLRLSGRSAPSADPLAPKPVVLLERGKGLRLSIDAILQEYGVKPAGKSSVVAGEFILSATSDYFGGQGHASWDKQKVNAWKKATLNMLKKQFGDRIASVVYHEDESAPHFHVYVVPLVKHREYLGWSPNARAKRFKDGQWKIAGREYFTRSHLIELQDVYGETIAPLGLHRGKRGSKAKHKEMRDAQKDLETQAKLQAQQSERIARDAEQVHKLRRDLEIALTKTKDREQKAKDAEQAAKQALENLQTQQTNLITAQDELRQLRKDIEDEKKAIQSERNRLRKIPIEAVLGKMGFVLNDESDLRLDILNGDVKVPHRAILTEDQRFKIEYWHLGKQEWTHFTKGKGAIDLVLLVPAEREPNAETVKATFIEACNKLAEWFPEQQAGILSEVLERRNPKLWDYLAMTNNQYSAGLVNKSPSEVKLISGPLGLIE